MRRSLYGELRVIGMKGCEKFVSQVDDYLKEWRDNQNLLKELGYNNCFKLSKSLLVL